ncbi:MAG TPA: ester cyclase [Cellvibrio sp.]|nr:ester cyclase [Cellvibrio sp.]
MKSVSKIILTCFVVGSVLLNNVAMASEPTQRQTSSSTSIAKQSEARATHNKLVADWVDLWNGKYSLANGIVSPDVRVRAALMDGGDGSAVKGPAGMVKLITQIRSAFSDLHFDVQIGPIVDGEFTVLRWVATGTYRGGFPGATAPAGTKVNFTGVDMLKVQNGLITDYWLNADTLLIVNQLKVVVSN